MSFLKQLFSKDSVIDRAMDAGDALVFTAQEKKEMFLKDRESYIPFKLAQRFLMFIVCIPFVLMALAMFVCVLADIGQTDKAGDILQGPIGWAFVSIVGFYTGGGALEGAIKAWGKK